MKSQERMELVDALLQRRVESWYPNHETVRERLADTERLTFYFGIDPTGKELHIGHTIPLLVLRDISRLGHDIILLIGDFTARIGDPTGKISARTALDVDDIQSNMESYIAQAGKFLPAKSFRVVYNSEWLSALTMQEVLKLTGMVTVQQMIQRDMFQERIKEEKPIYLNEFLYPLMQGYDSVALRTDGEVGGNDQTFNMLMGRELSRGILGKDKVVLATKLLVDAASGRKLSKTEGMLIAVNDSAQEIRKKVLAVDDKMIRTLFELCTDVPPEQIDSLKNPREAKESLAAELIRMYHGSDAVSQAQEAVEINHTGPLDQTLKDSGFVTSLGEAKRLVEQGGVRINGKRAERWDVDLKSGDEIKIGKGTFLKVK